VEWKVCEGLFWTHVVNRSFLIASIFKLHSILSGGHFQCAHPPSDITKKAITNKYAITKTARAKVNNASIIAASPDYGCPETKSPRPTF
jgi:hypothetical protein